MRRFLLSAGLFAAFVVPASAADPVFDTPETVVVPEADIWSGYFAGIQGGYGWGEVQYDFLDPSGGLPPAEVEGDFNVEGFVGGVFYGRNWQSGSLIFGLEGSLSVADLKDSVTISNYTGQLTVDGVDIVDDGPFDLEAGVQAFTTTRAKIGLAFDQVAVFVAGGLTAGLLEAELSGVDGSVDDDAFAFGWTVGAGVEAKLADNWSARVEYLYLNWGEETFFDGTDGEVDIEVDAHIVRGGIAYHF